MAESFFQVPPDSTGKKIRTRDKVIGLNTVHEQAVYQSALPTYYALVDAATFATNKQHISLINAAGSGKIVALRKVFAINLQTATVTGVAVRMDYKRATAHSAGTLITPNSADSANPALPAEITVRTGATVTEGVLLFPQVYTTDEIAAANTAVANFLAAGFNWIPEGQEIQELRMRPGEGFTLKQITAATVGSYAWMIVFTVDDEV